MRKIKLTKHNGNVSYLIPTFFILYLIVIIVYLVQIHLYEAVSTYTEDALTAASLASAVIDIEEYGVSHEIIVEVPDNAYQLYCTALRTNMELDENWMSDNQNAISGKVEILDYIVYNVKGRDISIYRYGESESTNIVQNGLGSVSAPNGKIIQSTSIYSRITFPVSGSFGVNSIAEKELLVDIVNN